MSARPLERRHHHASTPNPHSSSLLCPVSQKFPGVSAPPHALSQCQANESKIPDQNRQGSCHNKETFFVISSRRTTIEPAWAGAITKHQRVREALDQEETRHRAATSCLGGDLGASGRKVALVTASLYRATEKGKRGIRTRPTIQTEDAREVWDLRSSSWSGAWGTRG